MQEFKLVSIISWLFHIAPGFFESKSEIRRLIKQNGLTLFSGEGEWKPTEHTGMVFDHDNNLVGKVPDFRSFLK